MDDILLVLKKLTKSNGDYLRWPTKYCSDCGADKDHKHTYMCIVSRAERGLIYLDERY